MHRARWRTSIRPPFIPPLLVMGTAALMSLAAAQLAAAAPLLRTSAVSDCSTAGAAARAAMGRHTAAAPSVTQRLEAGGVFAGRGLALAGRAQLTLPVDSFIGQPVGDALVYTTSVVGHSEIHVVDLDSGCDTVVARPAGVARSAVLDPGGLAVYVHSVTFPGRTDAGVTRYALDGSNAQQVVPNLPDDARFGLTFATQLGWSSDGGALFAQSCGAAACRTRLMNIASGAITMFDGEGQGPIIGVSGGHLVTYGACDGLPCSVLSIDRSSGTTRTLVDEGWSTTFVPAASGCAIVRIETAAGTVEVPQ
jgi:hypothetical protein